LGISDLRNPVDSIKIKKRTLGTQNNNHIMGLSVHSIQSEIRNPKSEIEILATRNPHAVRKILTTKSEITQLTSPLLTHKLSC